MAKIKRNKIKQNVSKLFAVTRFTPNKIVLSKRPCDVLKPFLSTYPMQPLSGPKLI